MEFTSKLSGTSVSVYGKELDYNHEIDGNFFIEWQFYTEMREWGVKSISVYTTKVYGEITITNWEDDTQKELDFIDDGWEIESYTDDIKLEHSICPQDIEINYENKTITVNF